jgi:hypothetical protein
MPLFEAMLLVTPIQQPRDLRANGKYAKRTGEADSAARLREAIIRLIESRAVVSKPPKRRTDVALGLA